MQNRNYQKELEKLIEKQQREGEKPSLLLHSCCAPCSSYVLEYLAPYFTICDFYFNPNISPKKEYEDRKEELVRLISEMGLSAEVSFLEGTYQPEEFFAMAKGLEDLPEGGERCFKCYELRLEETAKLAQEMKMDYFTTTLSISPLKNAEKLNEIGERLGVIYQVSHLSSDFKKKNGYKRSVELSEEVGLISEVLGLCIILMKNGNVVSAYSNLSSR